ncbi:hypothetical protein MLD38_016931 [Melastoma candidum]|uniref:Uncharacterized protein n=1 Tax=Melastoma candidum TaxID=119954 RepID=A0ACB9QQV5_9MYRT|nr:hypothetical protein MLD38_016931 [Melastoma candidum]
MEVIRKVRVFTINARLKFVKREEARRRMLMRKFALQSRVPMFVGEEEILYGVPTEYVSSIMMKALLNTFEDQIQASRGPVKLPCSKEMFDSIMDLVKVEKAQGMAKKDGFCTTEFQDFSSISSMSRVDSMFSSLKR